MFSQLRGSGSQRMKRRFGVRAWSLAVRMLKQVTAEVGELTRNLGRALAGLVVFSHHHFHMGHQGTAVVLCNTHVTLKKSYVYVEKVAPDHLALSDAFTLERISYKLKEHGRERHQSIIPSFILLRVSTPLLSRS